jgi:tetratricopeptide (TPR) repeat protein
MTLDSLGDLYLDRTDYSEAVKSFQEALKTYRQLALANPQIYLPNVAITLIGLGDSQSDGNDHVGAEKIL